MENNQTDHEHTVFGKVISRYTQEEAIEDGVLVFVGNIGKERMVFTRSLFDQGYEDKEKRVTLIEKGLELLCAQDLEDSPDMRLRVIDEGKIWVIWHMGEGFTFLRPEDY